MWDLDRSHMMCSEDAPSGCSGTTDFHILLRTQTKPSYYHYVMLFCQAVPALASTQPKGVSLFESGFSSVNPHLPPSRFLSLGHSESVRHVRSDL